MQNSIQMLTPAPTQMPSPNPVQTLSIGPILPAKNGKTFP